MNEEQKSFINQLLKNGSIFHGLEDETINYKGDQVTVEYLIEKVVKPNGSQKWNVSSILKPIVNNNNYTEYNKWIRRDGIKSNAAKSNTYAYRLVNLVRDLVEQSENKKFSNKTFVVKAKKVTEIGQNNEDSEDTESAEKSVKSVKSEKYDYDFMSDDKSKSESERNISEITTEPEEEIEEVKEESKKSEESEKTSDKPKEEKTSSEVVKTVSKPIIKDNPLADSEKQLFKNIELALSYKNNKEYQDNNILQFKNKNGHIEEFDEPSKKLKALVHQQIADYMEMLQNKYYNSSEFRKHKREIIKKINDRYFGKNNIYGFKVYSKDSYSKSFEIKDLKDSKFDLRAKKNYVNQNAPNKYSFFVYNMKDIYSIIEEYLDIDLSVHSKYLIESIIHASVDRFTKNADKTGQISYNSISHGFELKDILKLIEEYINSKKNIHIKSKFELDSDARSKLMEVIQKEVDRNRNDYRQKSKNIISFIDNLEFT